MTKLKNTKKGMAKKALSISLVAAMLATSNVPVWAAEDLFSDGSAAVEAPVVEEPVAEVDTFSAEPVEEVPTDAPALNAVEAEGNISIEKDSKGLNSTLDVVKASSDNITAGVSEVYHVNWYITDTKPTITNGANSSEVINAITSAGGSSTENEKSIPTSDGGKINVEAVIELSSFVDKYLTAVVLKQDGGNWIAEASDSALIYSDNVDDYYNMSTVTLSGRGKVGSSLSLRTNSLTPSDKAKLTCEWYRKNGETTEKIEGATQNSYRLTKADVGYFVYPIVTVSTNNGYMTKSYSASAIEVVSDSIEDYYTSTLAVSGNVEIGSTLDESIVSGTIDPQPGASVSYAWVELDEEGNVENSLATADGTIPSYILKREDIGKNIYLRATIKVEDKVDTVGTVNVGPVSVQATTANVEVTWTGNGKELTTQAGNVADFGYVYKKGCDYKPEIESVTVGDTTYDYSEGKFNNVKWTNTDEAGIASVQFELKTGDENDGKVIKLQYNIATADLSKAEVSLSETYVYAPEEFKEDALKAAGLKVTLDGVELELFGDEDDKDVDYRLTASETGTKKGTLTILPKDENYGKSIEYKFDVAKKDISEAFVKDITDVLYDGKDQEPAPEVYYKESDDDLGVGEGNALRRDVDYSVSYSNNVKVGTATVTIAGKGCYTGTKTLTFEIVSAKLDVSGLICEIYDSKEFNDRFVDADGKKINLVESNTKEKAEEILKYISEGAYFEFTYDGYEQNPMRPAYGLEWTENKDYSYTYIGQRKNVGNFSIKVEGEGNYGSSFTLPCKIAPFSVKGFTQYNETTEEGDVRVADSIYNDKNLYTPEVTVTWNDLNLIKDFDYELTYKTENVDGVKRVKVTLTGIGNFKDEEYFYGKIVDKSINDSGITVEAIENQEYTGDPIELKKSDLVIKDGEKTLRLDTDFHIVEYKDNVKPGVATVVIGGLGNYTGTREVTFLIVDQEYTAYILNSKTGLPVLPDKEYNYNTANSEDGFVFTVGNKLRDGDIYLADAKTGDPIDSDKYEVTYENNKAAGTATIKVTGTEGYQISAIGTFKIKPKTLTAADLAGIGFKDPTARYTYTGEEIKPEVTVDIKDGKYQLVEGVDYDITYESNINAGTAKAIVTGKGNYAGLGSDNKLPKKELSFTINKADLTGSEVTVKDVAYAGGVEVTPDITIVNPISGKELVLGSEYTVTLKNAVNVGIAEAEIKLTEAAEKNYILADNAKKIKFNITAKDLKDVDISPIADQTVTGGQIKPAIVVMNGGVRLVEGYDYEVTYGENKEVGVGTVKITPVEGSKNYTGSKEATFNIVDEKPEVGKAEISEIIVNGNTVTPVLASEVDGAIGYDYVLATEEDYANGRVQISKNVLTTNTNFYYVEEGTYYVYCHAWKRDENGMKVFGAWSNLMKVNVTATTPETPSITKVEKSSNGKHLRITWTKSDNATGYDVVMGQALRKVNGEYRPVDYGTAVKKVTNGNTVSVIFYNVPKGTYYVGLHAYNRTSETGTKVFSKWSNSKKVTF